MGGINTNKPQIWHIRAAGGKTCCSQQYTGVKLLCRNETSLLYFNMIMLILGMIILLSLMTLMTNIHGEHS